MSETPVLTEAPTQDLARSRSYESGESSYDRGAVGTLGRRGDRLPAGSGNEGGPKHNVIRYRRDGSQAWASLERSC